MKAVLVMEMPGGCANCALCRMENRKGYNDYICVPKNRLAPMAVGVDKPDWCPLRPMPEKVTETLDDGSFIDGSDYGWNECIKVIEGSGEDG